MDELFRALPALLTEFEDNETVREAVVFAAWRKVAGKTLRLSAVPVQFSGKRLTVAVSDENWRKHLEHLSGQMIFKINSLLGSAVVTFIEFCVDETAVKKERIKFNRREDDEKYSEEEVLNEITPKIRRSADAIKDDNLRYQFLLAAGSCLARRKKMKDSQ
jgi:hypothetical protein